MTAWDLRSFWRALLAAVVTAAMAWLITAASDEGGLTAGVRMGRILPILPLCSAAGALLAVGTSRARSEVRTLEALGRTPLRSSRPAVVGAAAISFVAAVCVAFLSSVDVSAFYPRAPRGEPFSFVGGAFESVQLGVRVAADGTPSWLDRLPAPVADSLPPGGRIAAAAFVATAGLALPLVVVRWMARSGLGIAALRRRRAYLGASVVAMIGATILALQAAAAGALSPFVAIVPAVVLLLVAVWDVRAEAMRV